MKKVICAILSALLLFSSSLTAAVPAVAADQPFAHAVKVIKALKLMDSENSVDFFESQPLTREDAVRYILKLMNTEVSSSGSQQYFKDVTPYDDNYALIATAVRTGLVKGDGGNFRPADKVTGTEAVIMLMRAMGYDNKADPMGGTAAQYLAIALENNFLSGIPNYSGEITRGAFAKLLYNSFDIGIVEQLSFGSDNEFVISKEKTSLSFLNLARQTGIVTENAVTSIYDTAQPATSGRIIINQREFEVNGTNASDLLGYKTECYYMDEKNVDIPKIFYITTFDNEEMTLDLSAGSLEIENGKLKFYNDESGKSVSVDINPTTSIILNGKAVAYDLNVLVSASGSGKLLFVNNKDKMVTAKYGVVFVTSEVNDRVRSVDLENNMIYLRNSLIDGKPAIDLNDDYDEKQISIMKDGKNITLADINADSVITYVISGDRNSITITISEKTQKGKIDGYDTDKNGSITVNGTKYPMTSDFYAKDKIVVGSSAFLYLNANGYAVDMDITLDKNYAFLYGVQQEEGIDETITVKLFTANSTFGIFTLADKVTVYEGSAVLDPIEYDKDGKEIKRPYHMVEISDKITANEAAAKLRAMGTGMIVYAQNTKGLINEIRFAINIDPASTIKDNENKTRTLVIPDLEYYENKFVLSKKITTSTQGAYGNLGGVGTTNTVIFSIPVDGDKNVIENDCKAAVNLIASDKYYNNVQFFDAGIKGIAKIGFMQQGVAADITNNNQPFCIYKRTVQVIDKDGDTKQKIYYMKNGTEEGVVLSEDAVSLNWGAGKTVDNLSFGDVFIYETNGQGELQAFASVFDASKIETTPEGVLIFKGNGVGETREFQTLYGTLRYSGADGVTLAIANHPKYSFYPLMPNKNVSVFRIKMENEKIVTSDIGSIRTESFGANPAPGDKILVRANRGVVQEILVFEGGAN